jgi:hypothetical protein
VGSNWWGNMLCSVLTGIRGVEFFWEAQRGIFVKVRGGD